MSGRVQRRVIFHKVCAVIWLLLLVPAYLWFRESVFFVIAASIYANVKSDWAAAEAADDSNLMARIDELEFVLDGMAESLSVLRMRDGTGEERANIDGTLF